MNVNQSVLGKTKNVKRHSRRSRIREGKRSNTLSLTIEQKNALTYIFYKAQQESQKALNKNGILMIKAQNLKISNENLLKTLEYIRDEVALVINIHVPQTLESLVNDSHYRNQFETQTSGGYLSNESRITWENNMFNNTYNEVIPFDRCKYGYININRNNRPTATTEGYGDSYLILKPHVRSRTTCCYGDSGNLNGMISLGTLENYAHILVQFSDKELTDIVSLACSMPHTKNNEIIYEEYKYKEVQFHGPIALNTDVETLVINKRHETSQKVKELANNFKLRGIQVIYSNT